jgi:hypothetical protein
MMMMIIIVKMIIMKSQSYARIPSISHQLTFVSTTKITTFIYTMIIKIRNKPKGFLPSPDLNRKKYYVWLLNNKEKDKMRNHSLLDKYMDIVPTYKIPVLRFHASTKPLHQFIISWIVLHNTAFLLFQQIPLQMAILQSSWSYTRLTNNFLSKSEGSQPNNTSQVRNWNRL